MLSKSIFILLLTWLLPVYLVAQPVISKDCNKFRSGDCLIKQQVQYKDPGRKGENVLWDFSRQESINDEYELKYYSYDDSLMIGQEHRTLYKYIMRGDSLFDVGFENRTTLIDNREPELLLVYPSCYGNKYESYFHGNGDHCGQLFVTARGKSSVEIDAYGMMLLPSGDTLRHVIRSHQVKKMVHRLVPYPLMSAADTLVSSDSVDYHLSNDTIWMQMDIYRWYADGYRYPIFETLQNTTYLHGVPQGCSNTAFFYTPKDQYYDLDDDFENQAKRDEEQARMEAQRDKEFWDQIRKENEDKNSEIIDYDVSLSDGGNLLTLQYSLHEAADVSVILFDMQGRQISGSKRIPKPVGIYQETFSLAGCQPGEYTLRIVVNEKVFGMKIIK